jgi:hypothetical protein
MNKLQLSIFIAVLFFSHPAGSSVQEEKRSLSAEVLWEMKRTGAPEVREWIEKYAAP